MKKYHVYLFAILLMGLIGCQQKGAGERAGERVDEVIDNVKEGDSPFKQKGTMEKLGESVDEAIQPEKKNN